MGIFDDGETLSKLFGTDGIRGIWGKPPLVKDMVLSVGYHAAKSYQSKLQPDPAFRSFRPCFLLGRDTRGSGPEISRLLSQALSAGGCEVVDLGVLPTPAVSFLVAARKVWGGVVISASHNPAEFNGIKFFSPLGKKLPDDWEAEIEQAVASQRSLPDMNNEKRQEDPRGAQDYIAYLKSTFLPKVDLKGFKIVVDCANGAGYQIAPELLRELSAEIVLLGASPDGKNINQDCGALHPERMQETVRAMGALCGFALDGDGDRVIFTDEDGQDLNGDHLLAAAAEYLKTRGRLRGNKLVATVMSSFGLMRAMDQLGIEVIQTPVGDRYVAEAMEKTGAILGGEQAGHIIFSDYAKTGDGLVTALQILKILCETGRPLSELTALVGKCPQILLNIPVKEKIPLTQVPSVTRVIDQVERKLGKDGRVLVRYSGTEPLLRIMVEGTDEVVVRHLAEEIAGVAQKELGAV